MIWNRLLSLGAAVGIEIRGNDLVIALVKSRWKGAVVLGKAVLEGFRKRPAAEWGDEYQAFLKAHRFGDTPATLALPRSEAIVRLLSLPPMSRSELKSAVRYQLDGLHPYGEDNVYFSFAPVSVGTQGAQIAVVIAPRPAVDGYADLFAEAGVKLRGITVAAAGYHGASRVLRGRAPEPFLLADRHGSTFELYGESATRAFFSASFDARTAPFEKAVAAAASELRLPEEETIPLVVCGDDGNHSPLAPEQVLGSPIEAPPEFDLRRDAAVFSIALAGACPRLGWRTNLLRRDRRSSSARWPIAATAASSAAVVVVAATLSLRGPVQDSRYARELNQRVRQLEAVERDIRALEQRAEKFRVRRAQLEAFRRRPEADLMLVTELSRRLPKTAWLNALEVGDDSVQLTGQGESAAPLLGLLDSSGVVASAAFAGSITREQNREIFRIRAARRVSLPAAAAMPPSATPGPPAGIPLAGPAPGHSSPAAAHSGSGR